MRIILANDHGAVELKKRLAAWLTAKGHTVVNLGVDTEDRVDYPDMADAAVSAFAEGRADFGVVLCGTGIGISIAANKHKGIRCALVHDIFTATMAKEHNNANFIAMGGRISYTVPPEEILAAFMHAQFQGGRHAERLAKLEVL